MNRIIAGRRYDTETAQRLAAWDNGRDPGALNFLSEALYRKPTGELFLHGQGGPSTKYVAFQADGSMTAGERLTPIAEDVAREWAEHRLDADAYEAIFGEVEPMAQPAAVRMTISIPADLKVRIDAEARRSKSTPSELMADLLAKAL